MQFVIRFPFAADGLSAGRSFWFYDFQRLLKCVGNSLLEGLLGAGETYTSRWEYDIKIGHRVQLERFF